MRALVSSSFPLVQSVSSRGTRIKPSLHISTPPPPPPLHPPRPCPCAIAQAAQLAEAPGSWVSAQSYYDKREARLVGPKDVGPSSYTQDYPPKPHDKFRAPAPYVPAPMVPLGTMTSYKAEFPRKLGEQPRIPDRDYQELNPPEPVPCGSTTHAQFPERLPRRHASFRPAEVPRPTVAPAPVYRPPAVAPPPAPFVAPPAHVLVSSEPTPTTHNQRTLVAHTLERRAPPDQWPPAGKKPPPPEKIVVARPPIVAPVGWQLPQNRKALGLQVVTAAGGAPAEMNRVHAMIAAGSGMAAGDATLTTVRNNQENMCILILHGDSEAASECELLGQFDVVGIPPQAEGEPRIQIHYQVDNQGFLKVWARELDTNKHKVWIANGGKIVATK